jgi:hypothetical protein
MGQPDRCASRGFTGETFGLGALLAICIQFYYIGICLQHASRCQLGDLRMSGLRVHCFSVSFDGYSAGPDQDLANLVGVGGLPVFGWQFATRAHHQMHGNEGGETGLDNDMVMRGFEGIGAWILGRNMFGPVRGPWPDDSWRGWWGEIAMQPRGEFV